MGCFQHNININITNAVNLLLTVKFIYCMITLWHIAQVAI